MSGPYGNQTYSTQTTYSVGNDLGYAPHPGCVGYDMGITNVNQQILTSDPGLITLTNEITQIPPAGVYPIGSGYGGYGQTTTTTTDQTYTSQTYNTGYQGF